MRSLLLLALLQAPLLLAEVAATTTPDGFAIPQPGRVFSYPRDHGSHPDYRTEWWYITGHLHTANGQRHGFQATFFRQAMRPADGQPVQHIYLAHAALLQVATGQFIHEERLNRDGWDATASTAGLDLRNGGWTLRQTASGTLLLACSIHADAQLTLTLDPAQKLIVFGTDGVSRKGTAASAASHYLTWPRLRVSGTLRLENGEHAVTGEAWMDHEFSSSQLDTDQVGWDWASVQLNDGRALMIYRMRRADGSSDPASTLTWIDRQGTQQPVPRDDFKWTALSTWTSPRTKATYPNHIQIQVRDTDHGNTLRILELKPLAQDQELGGALSGLPYWEGACDVLDQHGSVIGHAFLELAGYAGDLAGHLRGQ